MPGLKAGQLYHLQADGPLRSPARPPLRPLGPADRSVRAGPGRHVPAGRRRHHPPAEVRGRRRALRLAGRSPPAPRPVGDRDLRDARARLHAGRLERRRTPGHVPGRDRKDSVFEVAGRDGRRADAGPRVSHQRFLGRAATTARNYWGYDSLAFFSPHRGYAAGKEPGCQVREFKEMVRALHQAGHRSDSRRRLQPHGRRQRAGPDA